MTWQPIETFVSDPNNDEESVLVAVDTEAVGEAWQDARGHWFWGSGGTTCPVLGAVTHWAPLPAHPTPMTLTKLCLMCGGLWTKPNPDCESELHDTFAAVPTTPEAQR
jgi:hypothetical protein